MGDATGEGVGTGTERRRIVKLCMGISAALILMGVVLARLGLLSFLTQWFVLKQDIALLVAGLVIARFAVVGLRPVDLPFRAGPRHVAWLALLLALAAWLGHRFVLMAYDMSRDEQMATFDALVYAQGHLVEPLAPMWRAHAAMLNTLFMYNATEHAGWISGYLPMNSAIRAVFSALHLPDWASPALLVAGLLALWRIVRRLWPQDDEALALALVLYAASGQVLVNAMTTYATTAHLALNLVWLALILRGDKRGDLGALLAGFVATGLHQPVPHPLFAAPILLYVARKDWARKEWRRGVVFFVGYALIGGFWLWWPHLVGPMVEAAPAAGAAAGQAAGFLTRLLDAFATRDGLGLSEMLANAMRFVAWQHVLLVPLAALALPVLRRDGLAAALAGGVVLTLAGMLVLLPYQGHGFGYRYLHGLIGNVILLAVYGWIALGEARAIWRPVLVKATALSVVVLLPLQLWLAHAFYAPYAAVRDQLLAVDADYVVVGASDVPFSQDLVFNPPKLDRRPVLILRELLSPEGMAALCATGASVVLVDRAVLRPIADYYGMPDDMIRDGDVSKVSGLLTGAGCRVLP